MLYKHKSYEQNKEYILHPVLYPESVILPRVKVELMNLYNNMKKFCFMSPDSINATEKKMGNACKYIYDLLDKPEEWTDEVTVLLCREFSLLLDGKESYNIAKQYFI